MKTIKRKEITTMKIDKGYNNEALVAALADRDKIYASITSEIDIYRYSDEQLKILENLEKLTQFQKDLLYLSSKMSVCDIAPLYGVSASLIYRYLREIQKILHNNE